jgi:hypothetical protein
MISIVKGTLNKLGLSVSELSNCDEPFEYRIDFVSENSEDLKYSVTKTPTNASNRLQIFEIEEGVDVTFALDGYYSYEVYQTTSDNLVEVGLLRVVSQEVAVPTIPESKNPQVYGREN